MATTTEDAVVVDVPRVRAVMLLGKLKARRQAALLTQLLRIGVMFSQPRMQRVVPYGVTFPVGVTFLTSPVVRTLRRAEPANR